MIRVGVVIENLDREGAPASYAHGLVRKLHGDPRVEPILLYCRGRPDDVPDDVARVACSDRPYPTSLLPTRPQLPKLERLEREHGIDIFHLNRIPDLGHWRVARATSPTVATVHGTLHWEELPVETHLPRGYRVRRRFFDRLGRYTLDCAFTVSEYVSRLLTERAGYADSRVTCTYEAIDDSFFELPPQNPPAGVPDEYLLHVSNHAPKKNLETAISALQALDPETELVVAGQGWDAVCRSLIEELGLEDRVQFRGYVPEDELVALYDHASCFVFPTFHETFGLPNVEAMARGTPVVTSDAFAVPEIVADGARSFIPPDDPTALRSAIEQVRSDERYRDRLIERGRRRAQRFTWEAHVDTLVSEYRSRV